jgi:hypothetical protein
MTNAVTSRQPRPASNYDANRHLIGGKIRRLKTIDDIDQRTLAGKRARELVAAIEADLGGVENLTAGVKQLIQRAAVLAAMIESSEAQWLSGKPIDLNNFLAAIGVQRRVLTTLGLERRSRDITPTLSEYLAQRTAATEEGVEADEEDSSS